ncbi:hypothetical protein PSACC_02716 [Paramicrosporidium saccamoebae]|uniref:C2 domain-containing protein n=1 Tax=Paramicrosporidium saccamoebae TaxID=1246581 RepID=A0A2H9TI90_9FUNG|nr:hypothetical protein PSACC_02716 [Paramicrosporidium saccamoebae]
MPCILKVHVEAARGLPAMDSTSEVADAYVEIRFSDSLQRTSVCRKTLNPVWREDFRFEVPDDTLLQDAPLELKVFDFDAITADDSVGMVTVDLNPLVSLEGPSQMAGWFPIYDTIRGARGELWVQNAIIVGLVDEVITEIDPDYHWSDSFRTSRSSNEASQRILSQMSCRLRRQMGRKALEMGGNSILAYSQWIDIEPYSQTITFRGLGTAAIMQQSEQDSDSKDAMDEEIPLKLHSKGIELATISKLPPGCISGIGGVVSAKSVKLLSDETDYSDAITRDRWLSELRDEIRLHARNLGCNIVLGYRENISIHEDLYILAAEGTACRIRGREMRRHQLRDDRSSEDETLVSEKAERVKRVVKRLKECAFCHLPRRKAIQRTVMANSSTCNICRKMLVPEMLLATTELTSDVEVFRDQRLVESFVCRPLRRKKDGEPTAATVSLNLPFVEYDLYRQLQFKLRYYGFNAVFGLRYQILASDTMIVALASGTGACLAALPEPQALQISRNIDIRDAEDEQIFSFQERVAKASSSTYDIIHEMYSDRFQSTSSESSSDAEDSPSSSSSSSSSEGDLSDDQSVVQIDDEADEDLLLTLVEPNISTAVLAGTLDTQPSVDPSLSPCSSLHQISHFVCQFRRVNIAKENHHPNSALSTQFSRHYEEMIAQLDGLFTGTPRIHCIRHQLNLVRSVELQIVTIATVFGTVNVPVASSKDLLEPITFDWAEQDVISSDSDDEDAVPTRPGTDTSPTVVPPASISFTTGTHTPSSVLVDNCGTIAVQLFKEIYSHESAGGFPGFVNSTISDAFSITRAYAASLGGNAVTAVAFKPAAFYENFKNQMHVVMSLTADVVEVEHDRETAWSLLQSI